MSEIEVNKDVGEEDDKPSKASKKKSKKNKKKEGEDDDDDEGEDKKEEQSDEEEELTITSEHVVNSIESLQSFIAEKGADLTPEKLSEEIHNQWVSIGSPLDIKYYIAFNSMFSKKILVEIQKYKSFWKK